NWVAVAAWRAVDVWDSERVLFIDYDGPQPHTLMAQIYRAGGIQVGKLAILQPGAATGWEQLRDESDVPMSITAQPVADVLAELADHGELSLETRRNLAAEAFATTAAYETAIARWFGDIEAFPETLTTAFKKVTDLRYGENPHQQAALYLPVGPAAREDRAAGGGVLRLLRGRRRHRHHGLLQEAREGVQGRPGAG
ncbi:MAG: hypothetical protein ABR611_15985, partial [Chthoniobacterales bacterium]